MRQEADQRRLAGTAGADDEDEFALTDLKGYLVEGNGTIVVDLGYIFKFNHRDLRCCSSRLRTPSRPSKMRRAK